ncbi:MAG: hypothetical protein ACI94Y_000399 [Maribacter sp.]|jgi:hypothetical protein
MFKKIHDPDIMQFSEDDTLNPFKTNGSLTNVVKKDVR